MNADQKPTTYKDAGVDIDAADSLVDAIRPLVAKTVRTGVVGGIGGFGGIFDPKAAGFDDPLLVSSTDGVGTKLKIAIETGRLDTIGIDLVAMCVNDIVVQGAEPLYFLDYFATGKLDVAAAEQVIRGVAAGCDQAGCALIGGETAEMPGLYGAGDFDLAGFAVGAVERGALITGSGIEAGDVLLGLAASGFHSNGYSLLRKLVRDAGLSYSDELPGLSGATIGERLLRPTRIYVKSLLAAMRETEIHGLAHITGGGLLENIPRVLPDGLAAFIDAASWTLPDEQDWARAAGRLPPGELARTFNCGIGMVVVVRAATADAVAGILEGFGETVYPIGRIAVAEDARRVILSGPAGSWGETADWTIPGNGRDVA